MLIRYFGYAISIVLFVLTFVFFILSIYFSYKETNKLLPTQRSQRINAKYLFLSFLYLSLSLFVFLITENGFSWDALLASVGLLVMLSLFLGVNYFITSKTTDYLGKNGFSPDILSKIRQIGKTNKKSDRQENSDESK
jgi:hypothetical protein